MTARHLDLGCGPIRGAHLATQAIPFDSNPFESASACDFLEHVPCVLGTPDGQGTRFPFIELMNKVWRVLKPGGLCYAITPVCPSAAAFMDPTHANVMTADTHTHFIRPRRLAAMYGFPGDYFAVRRVQLIKPGSGRVFMPPPANTWQRMRLAHRIWRGACGHLICEFEAI